MARAVGKRSGRQNHRKIARRGLMFVLSSPSGAGKTTLSRMLLKADRNIALSVSVTTRPKRRGEVNGRDYHFIDPGRFTTMVKSGELLEWAEVFDHRYGTPRRPVEQALRRRPRRAVRHRLAGHAATAGKGARRSGQRLYSAADRQRTGAPAAQPRPGPHDIILGRMAKAAGEMSHWPEYDYVIVNSDKARAFAEIRAILAAERLKRERQIGLSDFVRGLQEKL